MAFPRMKEVLAMVEALFAALARSAERRAGDDRNNVADMFRIFNLVNSMFQIVIFRCQLMHSWD